MCLSYTTPIFSRHFPQLTPTAKHSSSSLRACASQLCKYLRYLGWLDGLVSLSAIYSGGRFWPSLPTSSAAPPHFNVCDKKEIGPGFRGGLVASLETTRQGWAALMAPMSAMSKTCAPHSIVHVRSTNLGGIA